MKKSEVTLEMLIQERPDLVEEIRAEHREKLRRRAVELEAERATLEARIEECRQRTAVLEAGLAYGRREDDIREVLLQSRLRPALRDSPHIRERVARCESREEMERCVNDLYRIDRELNRTVVMSEEKRLPYGNGYLHPTEDDVQALLSGIIGPKH